MTINTHTLLHIGAGQASDLEQWLVSGVESIVLIEPNPLMAEQLRQRTAELSQVTVVEAAITTEPQKNVLYEYNVPNASSLNTATGLKALFPGLKALTSRSVSTLSPARLLEQYGPRADQTACLIIEAVGEELGVIQALLASKQIKNFTQLHLTTSLEPLYEGSVPTQTLLDLLQENGYEIIKEISLDPDWSSWVLQRNLFKDEVSELHAALETKSTALAHEQDIVQKQQAELEKTQQALAAEKDTAKKATQEKQKTEEALQASQHALEALKAEQQEQVQTLEETIKANRTALAHEQDTVQKQQAELEKTQQALAAEKDSAKKAAQEKQKVEAALQASQRALETLNAKQQEHVQALEDTIKTNRTALAHEQDTVQKQQAELEKIQHALAAEKDTAKKATQEKQKAEEALQAAEQKIKETESQLNQYKKQVEQEQAQLQAELDLTKSALQDNKGWLASRKKQLEQAQQELSESLARIDEQKLTSKKLEEIESKINKFSSDLDKKLDKKLVNTAKQIENAMGLQSYLASGELPLSYHGWPISPDLALYLTEKIETQNYDLIIEFGSGTSTVLFAKVLVSKAQRGVRAHKVLTNQAAGLRQEYIEDAVIPNGNDLPKRVIAFEHNKSYSAQTMSLLQQAGLEQVVELVHAPLVDFTYQAEDYLYYDCESTLRKIAKVYEGREPHILVLVDGPPAATSKNARFPALPLLLNLLPKARFDLILDDYNRSEEKDIVEKWKVILNNRSISFIETPISLEKGAVLISIND